jgi:hypothetical protein
MKLFRINPQSPEAIEVLCAIEAANNLSKKIREVFEYAVYAGAESDEGLPSDICSSLTLLIDFSKAIEKLESPVTKTT